MCSSICSSLFRVDVLLPQCQWQQNFKNLRYWKLSHSERKFTFFIQHYPISSSFDRDDSSISPSSSKPTSKPKQSQVSYDPSEEIFGLSTDPQPRKVISDSSNPKSWFGPNGQYIRELPCPSCRGRGYTPCMECGIERSRSDCSLCKGKGITVCAQCLGECVIWEESIDEQPWEKARSVSPLKVKEDDEVDNLDIKLDVKRKTKRVYQSPPPEVNMKISRSLKLDGCRASMLKLEYSVRE